MNIRLAAITVSMGFAPGVLGQSPSPSPSLPPLVSPEVHADRRVTFRLRAPAAKEVLVTGEWSRERTPLTRDASGDWSATLGPLPSDLYGYSFIADGLAMADPLNPQIKLARQVRTSIVDVPGDPPRPDEFQPVPHGTVHLHRYASKSLGRPRGLTVYTPPGYETDPSRRYPVLYLLHGSGDNEATWMALGRAHWILDNLIAQGSARPMLLVMADGHPRYPTPPGPGALQNADDFERDLLQDVVPFVEAAYRAEPRRESRAVAGVSMGGGHALLFGMRHPDVFGWVIGLSSSMLDPENTGDGVLRAAGTLAAGRPAPFERLWFACGKTDTLLAGNEKLAALLKAKGVAHTFEAVDGGHNWPQWRRYLVQVAPALFTKR